MHMYFTVNAGLAFTPMLGDWADCLPLDTFFSSHLYQPMYKKTPPLDSTVPTWSSVDSISYVRNFEQSPTEARLH